MDTTKVASQLISFLGNNQELIGQFVEHPYSTTAKATGAEEQISKSDMSQILTQVAAQLGGQSLGGTETASAASALMGQSGDSIHSLASMLFGGAADTQAAAAPAAKATDAAVPAAAATATAKKADNSAMMAEILTKTAAGAVSSRVFASLLTGALGLGQTQKK